MMKGLMSVLLVLVLVAVASAVGKPDMIAPQIKAQQIKAPQIKIPKKTPQTLSRGWGDELTWCQTYEEALYRSHANNKPLMVIFHLDECPHSQALKSAFATNKEIQKIADEDFIILNLVFETNDEHLYPDGQYVPRILFVDPSYTIRADIIGKYSNRMYAYEPDDVKILLANMQKAKKLLKTEL